MVATHRWLRVVLSCIVVASGLVVLSGDVASAATREEKSSERTVKTNGVWPTVGKVCGPGAGGRSSVRGVHDKSINIAVFNDAANTIEPGLEIEFLQSARAFADWCNAAGGIDGRKIVINDRDAALFNAAQVTEAACRDDFMAVGGGMALDAPSVPVRVKCGLGQITGYVVSNQAIDAKLQVNPEGTNNHYQSAGFYGALAKAYPKAVRKASLGAQDDPGVINSYRKYEAAAEAQGWKVVYFQIPPLSVDDWTPYIEQLQTKRIEALEPSEDSNITTYVQAMNTAGYKPTFMLLGTQFYNGTTLRAASSSRFPTTYVETQFWPFQLASKSPGLRLLMEIMHRYARGDKVDFDDEIAFDSWVLWAKSATACGSDLTVGCVLGHASAQKNWTAGDIQAPVAHLTMSNENPRPSACFVLLTISHDRYVYDKKVTRPTRSIWNCNPKGVVKMPTKLANG